MKVPEQRSAGYLGCIPPEFVREVRPDVIVSYDALMENLAQSDVLADYVQEVVPPLLPDDLAISDVRQHWFGRQLNILVRKEAYRGPIETCAVRASAQTGEGQDGSRRQPAPDEPKSARSAIHSHSAITNTRTSIVSAPSPLAAGLWTICRPLSP